MKIEEVLHGSFWLFDTSVFIPRFDVLDSPSGIFTDLSWDLSDRYLLPRIADLTAKEGSLPLKAAWHEKGLFFQCDYIVKTDKPFYLERMPQSEVQFSINTRHAPGIQRANANCTSLVCVMERTCQALPQFNGNFRKTRLAKAQEVSGESVDFTFAPAQSNWLQGEMVRTKVFIGTQCLPNFNPVEFPEISFSFSVQSKFYEFLCFANTYFNGPSNENPSKWCRAKLVEK